MVIFILFLFPPVSFSLSLLVCIALPFPFRVNHEKHLSICQRQILVSFFLLVDFIASTIENNRKRRRRTTTTSSSMVFVHLCLILNHSEEHSRLSLSLKGSKLRSFPISYSYLYQTTGDRQSFTIDDPLSLVFVFAVSLRNIRRSCISISISPFSSIYLLHFM
jgi:hypothetical protein